MSAARKSNPCGKSINYKNARTHAYEVWVHGDWTWYVLKKYQLDDAKPYARAFCLVVTPFTGPSGDLGDVYIKDYQTYATKVIDRVPKEAS